MGALLTTMDGADEIATTFTFETEVIYWRGPAPFFYAPIPPDQIDAVRPVARAATYGWGCVPVVATVGGVTFKTSLFPKDGTYLVPLKVAVRRKTEITGGDRITVEMTIEGRATA